ncbi:methyl-accepting chemotaxis protein, partial [Candidatus Poribacteria bacterium]
RAGDAARSTGQLIEESTSRIENGVKIAGETAEALADINTNTEKVSGLLGEISAASKEQAQGIEQVNVAVSQMDKVVQSNAANSEESASASEELSAQAGQLNDMVVELTAVVGGSRASRNGNGHVSSGRSTATQQRMTMRSGGGNGLQNRVHSMLHRDQRAGAQVVTSTKSADSVPPLKPEEQIPLDNEDFRDF